MKIINLKSEKKKLIDEQNSKEILRNSRNKRDCENMISKWENIKLPYYFKQINSDNSGSMIKLNKIHIDKKTDMDMFAVRFDYERFGVDEREIYNSEIRDSPYWNQKYNLIIIEPEEFENKKKLCFKNIQKKCDSIDDLEIDLSGLSNYDKNIIIRNPEKCEELNKKYYGKYYKLKPIYDRNDDTEDIIEYCEFVGVAKSCYPITIEPIVLKAFYFTKYQKKDYLGQFEIKNHHTYGQDLIEITHEEYLKLINEAIEIEGEICSECGFLFDGTHSCNCKLKK